MRTYCTDCTKEDCPYESYRACPHNRDVVTAVNSDIYGHTEEEVPCL